MRAVYFEGGIFVVIEQPCVPGVGVVAGVTVCAQPGFVDIIIGVALVTV